MAINTIKPIEPVEPVEEFESVIATPIPIFKNGRVAKCERLNIRNGSDINSKVLTSVPIGTNLVLGEKADGFYAVTLENGMEGFAMADYIEIK